MGNLIELGYKSFLREHPFLDPISAPTPVQTHSFIYPGDEILLYHGINLPADLSGIITNINQLSFVSAKVSLIAQRPGVFTEQFSLPFLSSHHFVLDSFIAELNNSNAPIIPWGADGYAPFINLSQDRAFKLPSGDLRRQIKYQTTHTNGTTNWKYWFYFPVLFRWEYWIQLINASNDFYNPAEPFQGLNQWWFHYYYYTAAWKIKSRLDLTVMIAGVQTIIRSELDLTPNVSGDIHNYNTNSDLTAKSIKTSVILGTPSNTPCLIKNNEHTEVFGFFTKVSAWSGGEQSNISAVVWIEPFEGAGTTVRTRASSLYSVGSESVFMGLDTSITDDSGIGIQTSLGDYITIDATGNGAIVYFDGVNPAKVTVFALIDYVKLNAIYPGITKFTLYVRLYNKTIVAGETKLGEELKQDAVVITVPSQNNVCTPLQRGCPFDLDVFADNAGTDDLKNDKSDFYEGGDSLYTNIVFTLQKNTDSCGAGTWEDKQTVANNTLGNYFAFGKSQDFLGSDFMDDYGRKYTGLMLAWSKVLNAYGVGTYRMKVTKTDIFAANTITYDERIFCLKAYHCNLINKTVRIETYNEGLRGSLKDSSALIDYNTGWKSQIRLKGVLKFAKSTYVSEKTHYGDVSHNAIKNYISEQVPKYILSLRPVPGWMDYIISTNILQADQILVTDYNDDNRHTFVKHPVINDGDMAPVDNNLRNPNSSIDINLSYGLNNLRRRNSY